MLRRVLHSEFQWWLPAIVRKLARRAARRQLQSEPRNAAFSAARATLIGG